MTTITIQAVHRGNAPSVATLCNQMTSTLHAQVKERAPYIPGWIVLSVTAPKDRVEIACELWLAAHYENWRVES